MGAALLLGLSLSGRAVADDDHERHEHEEHERREHEGDYRRWQLQQEQPHFYYQEPGYDPYQGRRHYYRHRHHRYNVPEDSDVPQDSD